MVRLARHHYFIVLAFFLSFTATGTELQRCPIRFSNLPSSGTVVEIGAGRLVADGILAIQVLDPREEGFFAIRSSESDTGDVYGEYWARKPKSREYLLKWGANNVAWRPASLSPDGLVAPVPSGDYRLVLRYLSPEGIKMGTQRLVCFAISRSIHLTTEFYLHSFE